MIFISFLMKHQFSETQYKNQSETVVGDKKLPVELYVKDCSS